jgi:hypothetical protein
MMTMNLACTTYSTKLDTEGHRILIQRKDKKKQTRKALRRKKEITYPRISVNWKI